MKLLPLALVGASLGLSSAALRTGAAPATPPDEIPWDEILGAPEGERPAPQKEVRWRESLGEALAEAAESERPLFVTLRCLPCKQCAGFDQAVLEGGPLLDPLLKQFVTVRLTDASVADLRVLPMEGFQDLDLSWWGWFLSPDARVYGIFGGKDHVSDTTRISPEALAAALERVLDHHADPRRADWDVDGPAPDLAGAAVRPEDLPGFASWSGRLAEREECLHCHQVLEILRQPALDAGTFDKQRDLEVWPLPENVGLVLDRDDGLLVTEVEPESPAEQAGLRAGDRLASAGDRRLFGQTDFRGVLHRGPRAAGTIDVRWLRNGELHAGALEVAGGWRQTVLPWRMSVSQGNVGAHPGFAWGNRVSAKDRKKLGIPSGSMAIRPWFGKKKSWPAVDAGLRGDDVIVAVDEEAPDVYGREFMAWFRLNHDSGDTVVLTVTDRRGRDREVRYVLP